jgi:hypothetical protein
MRRGQANGGVNMFSTEEFAWWCDASVPETFEVWFCGKVNGRKSLKAVEVAYVPGSWLVPARQQYYILQHRCTLCIVPVY